MTRKAIIVGAGQIGRAAARAFGAAGWQTEIITRSPPDSPMSGNSNIKLTLADRSDHRAFSCAVGEGADFLLDTIAYNERDAAQLISMQDCLGAVCVISSASVYCDEKGRNIYEGDSKGYPKMPERFGEEQSVVEAGPSTYSTRKVALEHALFESARIPVTSLRPCAIHGPYSRHPREYWFVKRMLDGRRRIPLANSGANKFQTSAADNIAALILRIAETGETGIFNAVDPDSPSVLEIGKTIAGLLGEAPEFVSFGGYESGVTPWHVPHPFTLSDAKARSIGYTPLGCYDSLVSRAVDWLVQQPSDNWRSAFPQLASYPADQFGYAAEDKIMDDAKND